MTFYELYNCIALSGKPQERNYPRLDNWACDIVVLGNYSAQMMDAGYFRSIAYIENEKVQWRVYEAYPHPVKYEGITEEDFSQIKM